jgi:pimeloyl-ACP methyl ester carboxylesterase
MTLRHVVIHGRRVAVRSAGTGPVLLLIHGMAGSSLTWRHVAPALAGRFTVVAPDLLGHGDSAKPRTEYSISAHANVLRDLLTTLDIEHATFVGQSLGGGVAMQLAYQYPERCERLVLVSSGGLGREVSPLLRGLAVPGAEQVFPLVCSPALRDAGDRVGSFLARFGLRPSPVVEEIWRSYAALADGDARRAFFRTLGAVIDPGGQAVSATDRLYLAAHLPTLIVWGSSDALIPVRHGVAAHHAIAGSRLEVFEGVGHFPHCEAPERFVRVLADFVSGTAGTRMSFDDWSRLLRGRSDPDRSPVSGEMPAPD